MQQTSVKKRVIGVDIGNACTNYAIVDIRGNVIAHDSFPTSDYTDINKFVEKLAECIITIAETSQSAMEGDCPPGCHAPRSVRTGCSAR